MKKFIFVILFLSSAVFSIAQDIIVKINNEEIKCKIKSTDKEFVYYTTNISGSDFHTTILKENVYKLIFNAEGDPANRTEQIITTESNACLTIGILQGGGSLIGLDLELPIAKRITFQLGGGFVGFGAGLNIHVKPTIRSSFFSVQYWHQGIGDSYTQSLVSANYVYRGKKWLQGQIGIGIPLGKGLAWDDDLMEQPPIMLTYAIGIYLPL